MNDTIRRLAGGLLLAVSTSALAGFETLDTRFGADTLIVDHSTGLQWLRLDITEGTTYETVWNSLDAGDTFDGFRMGTSIELETMFRQFDIPSNGGPDFEPTAEASAEVASFINIMAPGRTGARGYMHGHDPLNRFGFYAGITPQQWFTDGMSSDRTRATWLHTVAPVPEPQTWALMLIGVAAVGFHLRKRSARSEQAQP